MLASGVGELVVAAEGREGGKEGGREGRRGERGRKGGREGGRERERGKDEGREGGRKGGREGGIKKYLCRSQCLGFAHRERSLEPQLQITTLADNLLSPLSGRVQPQSAQEGPLPPPCHPILLSKASKREGRL